MHTTVIDTTYTNYRITNIPRCFSYHKASLIYKYIPEACPFIKNCPERILSKYVSNWFDADFICVPIIRYGHHSNLVAHHYYLSYPKLYNNKPVMQDLHYNRWSEVMQIEGSVLICDKLDKCSFMAKKCLFMFFSHKFYDVIFPEGISTNVGKDIVAITMDEDKYCDINFELDKNDAQNKLLFYTVHTDSPQTPISLFGKKINSISNGFCVDKLLNNSMSTILSFSCELYQNIFMLTVMFIMGHFLVYFHILFIILKNISLICSRKF